MKSRRRREWFRRSSAMFMALALIISGLSLPEGLFSITAKAAEKASAEWTVSSTMYACVFLSAIICSISAHLLSRIR